MQQNNGNKRNRPDSTGMEESTLGLGSHESIFDPMAPILPPEDSDPSAQPPTNIINNNGKAIDQLTNASASLPKTITQNMVNNSTTMLRLYKEICRRQETLDRIKPTGSDEDEIKIGSISNKKGGPSPVTCSKILDDDEEAKDIKSRDEELTAKFNAQKKKLIVEMATREVTFREEVLRKEIFTILLSTATDLAIKVQVKAKYQSTTASRPRMANKAVAIFLEDRKYEEHFEVIFRENGKDLVKEYNAHNNVVESNDFTTLYNSDSTIRNQVNEIANLLGYNFPLMTIPFWREYDDEEAERKINKLVTLTTKAAEQEKAQSDVEQALAGITDGDQPQMESILEQCRTVVKETVDSRLNAYAQKQKRQERLKSSGADEKDQDARPGSNGQRKSRKSKNNKKKSEQRSKEQQQQQQNGSNPRGMGGGQQRRGHGDQGGGGQGNRGGSNNGKKGKGRKKSGGKTGGNRN